MSASACDDQGPGHAIVARDAAHELVLARFHVSDFDPPCLRGRELNVDPEVRAQAYADANNAIRDLVPMVPIATGNSSSARGRWAHTASGI